MVSLLPASFLNAAKKNGIPLIKNGKSHQFQDFFKFNLFLFIVNALIRL